MFHICEVSLGGRLGPFGAFISSSHWGLGFGEGKRCTGQIVTAHVTVCGEDVDQGSVRFSA
jgi:hypothetical protein